MKKFIAHYLPQYHEFEENNKWWGKGFTEWTCVNRAEGFLPDHRIKKPHKDIGYYCLLDKDIRKKQAEIAKKYSIYGFCYYHYWFGDKVLLDKPLQLMLQDGEPNIPFCFSWANEPWTRRMNGGSGELLQPNNYGDIEEWDSHIEYLLPFFKNSNYILVNNKPMFLIYRLSQIPNYKKRFNYYNQKLKKEGFDGIFTVMTIGNFKNNDDIRSLAKDVDACVDFHPNFLRKDIDYAKIKNFAYYDMPVAYEKILNSPVFHKVHFKGTMVGFDSSPRNPIISNVFINESPVLFKRHLKKLIKKSKDEFIFINAWNEWGEGCALEPEQEDLYGYLRKIKSLNVKLI